MDALPRPNRIATEAICYPEAARVWPPGRGAAPSPLNVRQHDALRGQDCESGNLGKRILLGKISVTAIVPTVLPDLRGTTCCGRRFGYEFSGGDCSGTSGGSRFSAPSPLECLRPAQTNAEPGGGRAISHSIGDDPAEGHCWNWIDRARRPSLIAFFTLTLGGMVLWGIKNETAQIDFHLLVSALRTTPTASLAAALAATALSYLALVGYDVSGLRYARARAPLKTILLASFCGFAIGNSIGLGAFSGGAVRYRLYTAAGLSPGQVARVILFISVAFGVGLGAIAALGLILDAKEVSGLLGASPEPLRAGAATVLALAVGFMVFCALRRTSWRRGPIDIDAPDTTLVLIQFLFTAVDVLAAAATLWVLLPSVGISFFSFAAIYAAALALGVLSHVPGGLGVFELAILYAVGRNAPVNAVAAALVTYRGIYFLLPLLLSTALLANFELQRSLDTAMGRRIVRAASQLAPNFLAVTTFTVGAILVVSGAMPAFVDRLQILQIAVPLWAIEVSHFLTSVAGLFLLFAAYGLYRRLDGAWWLALSMTLLSIPFSLIKGLAVVAPSVSIILLIGLVAARRQFSRRASLLSEPLSLGWFIAIGCVIAAMVWVLFFAFRNVEYTHELWWQFEFDATAPRALRAVLGVAMLGLALGVSQLLRPARAHPARPTGEEIDRARQIAATQPHPDALLALMGDKSFLFSDSGAGFLMFATHGRTWVALGDPVGPPGGMAGPRMAFHRACRQQWRQGRLLSDTAIEFAALSRRRSQNLQARRSGPCSSTLLLPRRLCSGRSPLCLEAWRARRPSVRDDPARTRRLNHRRDRVYLERLANQVCRRVRETLFSRRLPARLRALATGRIAAAEW